MGHVGMQAPHSWTVPSSFSHTLPVPTIGPCCKAAPSYFSVWLGSRGSHFSVGSASSQDLWGIKSSVPKSVYPLTKEALRTGSCMTQPGLNNFLWLWLSMDLHFRLLTQCLPWYLACSSCPIHPPAACSHTSLYFPMFGWIPRVLLLFLRAVSCWGRVMGEVLPDPQICGEFSPLLGSFEDVP